VYIKINFTSLAKCKNVESLHSCDASDSMRASHQGRFGSKTSFTVDFLCVFTNFC
jgi:hypothetical protein